MCHSNLPLLEVDNLSVSFRMYDRAFGQRDLKVIQDLAITVNSGEILAVVGSSGSGKACWPTLCWACCRKMLQLAEGCSIRESHSMNRIKGSLEGAKWRYTPVRNLFRSTDAGR